MGKEKENPYGSTHASLLYNHGWQDAKKLIGALKEALEARMKTVFVVFTHFPDSDEFTNFLCVRRTFEKAAKVGKSNKPALILEMSTVEGETECVNRCELS